MVILHGLFGFSDNWQTHAKKFASYFRVVLVDLRNHGHSPWSDEFSYEIMAEDVHELFVDLGLEEAILIGHSMGGKVAMVLAITQPEILNKLIVVDIAPVTYPQKSFAMLDAMIKVDLATVERREDADAQLSTVLADAMLRAFIVTNLRRGPTGYGWRVNVDAIVDGLVEILEFPGTGSAVSTVPALFLGGHDSDYIPGNETAITNLFTNASIQMIEGAGHWPHADKPEETVEHVKRFLDEGRADRD